MQDFSIEGSRIRSDAKALVLRFMKAHPQCSANAEGLTQTEIFRNCGFDWGDYPHATSSNQQYWFVASLQELKDEGKIERDPQKRWHVK